MRIAYIIGPYRATDLSKQLVQINSAEQVAKEFWRRGYAVICPHMNSKLFDAVATEKTFLDGYLEILDRLTQEDLVVVLPGWEKSKGSVNEMSLANLKKVPMMKLTREQYQALDN